MGFGSGPRPSTMQRPSTCGGVEGETRLLPGLGHGGSEKLPFRGKIWAEAQTTREPGMIPGGWTVPRGSTATPSPRPGRRPRTGSSVSAAVCFRPAPWLLPREIQTFPMEWSAGPPALARPWHSFPSSVHCNRLRSPLSTATPMTYKGSPVT